MPDSENAVRENRGADDEAPNLHERFFDTVLDHIVRDRYPSNEVLDLLESCMRDRDRREIAMILLEKVAAQRYPSPAMLRRLAQLVG